VETKIEMSFENQNRFCSCGIDLSEASQIFLKMKELNIQNHEYVLDELELRKQCCRMRIITAITPPKGLATNPGKKYDPSKTLAENLAGSSIVYDIMRESPDSLARISPKVPEQFQSNEPLIQLVSTETQIREPVSRSMSTLGKIERSIPMTTTSPVSSGFSIKRQTPVPPSKLK